MPRDQKSVCAMMNNEAINLKWLFTLSKGWLTRIKHFNFTAVFDYYTQKNINSNCILCLTTKVYIGFVIFAKVQEKYTAFTTTNWRYSLDVIWNWRNYCDHFLLNLKIKNMWTHNCIVLVKETDNKQHSKSCNSPPPTTY